MNSHVNPLSPDFKCRKFEEVLERSRLKSIDRTVCLHSSHTFYVFQIHNLAPTLQLPFLASFFFFFFRPKDNNSLSRTTGREEEDSPRLVCALPPSLGRHFDADLSGYRGWASNPLSPSSPPLLLSPLLAMDGESAASEDNNDYLSRKRQKEQASERGGLYLLWVET